MLVSDGDDNGVDDGDVADEDGDDDHDVDVDGDDWRWFMMMMMVVLAIMAMMAMIGTDDGEMMTVIAKWWR